MNDAATPTAQRPRRFTVEERRGFAHRRILPPMVLFLGLVALYAGLVLLSIATPPILAIVPSVLCGVTIGMLFIVGHDACHNSLTASSRLNRILARLAFLPALHSASLWDRAHNRTHHRHNNLRGWDYVWEPMTAEDYQGHGSFRRALYRFYRTPAGVAFYYLIEIWAPRLILPRAAIVSRVSKVHVFDSALVLLFLAAQIFAVIAVGDRLGRSPLFSVLFGVLVPFLVWSGFMSFIVFLHHTHPSVPWYASIAAWEADQGDIRGTAHVRFPPPFGAMVLSIMEHNAHHHASGVPLYSLPAMQGAMDRDADFVIWRFSWRAYARVCQRCKLYDYDAGRWTSFAALPDGPVGGTELSA